MLHLRQPHGFVFFGKEKKHDRNGHSFRCIELISIKISTKSFNTRTKAELWAPKVTCLEKVQWTEWTLNDAPPLPWSRAYNGWPQIYRITLILPISCPTLTVFVMCIYIYIWIYIYLIWAAAFIYDVAAVKKIHGVPPPRLISFFRFRHFFIMSDLVFIMSDLVLISF